jgi:hypothetical protein
MAENEWWAWQGLNLRPLRCQHSAFNEKAQKSDTKRFARRGTRGEQSRVAPAVYRAVTASGAA